MHMTKDTKTGWHGVTVKDAHGEFLTVVSIKLVNRDWDAVAEEFTVFGATTGKDLGTFIRRIKENHFHVVAPNGAEFTSKNRSEAIRFLIDQSN